MAGIVRSGRADDVARGGFQREGVRSPADAEMQRDVGLNLSPERFQPPGQHPVLDCERRQVNMADAVQQARIIPQRADQGFRWVFRHAG